MNKAKNVIVIMADQHRQAAAGCYNNEYVKTPHLDALSKRGIIYNNAFTACPLCGPSRASFITGTYPYVHENVTHPNKRYRTGEQYKAPLSKDVPSLIETFRQSGYKTLTSGYLGIMGFRDDKKVTEDELGFSEVRASSEMYREKYGNDVIYQYNANGILGEMWEPFYQNTQGNVWPYEEDSMWDKFATNETINFLDKAKDDNIPFFAYLGFRAPHPPWVPPKRFRDMYDENNIGELPDYKVTHIDKPRRLMERFDYYDCRYYPEDVVRNCIASYYAFVSYVDDCVGQIIKKLEECAMLDNTIIVYSADHGELLFDHGICEKHCMLEGAVRIPLIISGPGIPNKRSDALVENVDIMPTLIAACGLELPETKKVINGKNIIEAYDGNEVREYVFSEYYHSLDPTRMIRDKKYKFVYTLDDINELYDIENDPMEMHNLCMYSSYAKIAEKMEKKVLEDWIIPNLPLYALWNDLRERKQKQLLAGAPVKNYRPAPPNFIMQHASNELKKHLRTND